MVVPHGFGLHDPGLCGFRCVRAVGGALSPVECCVEGFPGGAFAACEGGGLEESLLAPWGVFRVYFRGIGLGRHEDSVCPRRTHHWASALRMWMAGCWGGVSRVFHDAMASGILERWRSGGALRLRS